MTRDSGEELLIAEALAFTIESLLMLPDTRRPVGDIADMQKILAKYPASVRQRARLQALSWLRPETTPHHQL